jgi:hypothetical protein
MILDENNSLIIQNLTLNDEAVFSCRAYTEKTGKAVVKEGKLIVQGKQKLVDWLLEFMFR